METPEVIPPVELRGSRADRLRTLDAAIARLQALKRAIKFSFGKEAVFVRDGGTIGAMTSIEKVLNCPVLFLGLSLPEHGYHAPNENFDWQQASGGMVAFAKYFEEISNLSRR